MPKYNPINAVPLKEDVLNMSKISRRAVEEHYKLYEGYVKKVNETREKLLSADKSAANQTYSEWRALKEGLSFALNGVKNHEIYFDILGGKGGEPTGEISQIINEGWGSYENWRADMKSTGISARGWVWMAKDLSDGKYYNYLGDSQNTYPIWNAVPIIALDTYEHAYWMDFGSDRGSYIEEFFNVIDWDAINKRLV